VTRESPENAKHRSRLKEYVLGVAVGILGGVYGVYALMSGSTYIPGLQGGTATARGSHGVGAALVYLTGGVFLLFRFFVHPRCRSESARSQVYLLENLLLIAFIGSALYVLLRVGTAG